MCHQKGIFYITVAFCSLAWSSGHMKGNTEGDWHTSFLFCRLLFWGPEWQRWLLNLAYEASKIDQSHHSWLYKPTKKKKEKETRSEDITSSFFVLPCPLILLISGAGNRFHRHSDATELAELSKSPLKTSQFTSWTTCCRWPSWTRARRRLTR